MVMKLSLLMMDSSVCNLFFNGDEALFAHDGFILI